MRQLTLCIAPRPPSLYIAHNMTKAHQPKGCMQRSGRIKGVGPLGPTVEIKLTLATIHGVLDGASPDDGAASTARVLHEETDTLA